ncbi:rRNA-processing protein [Yarrowia sp. C11]|nr:rRNA-processing protein [Yarrowia sp. C11]KAG5370804.1 rRNA-processing protein [Yarrowia sp. E02]
MAQDKKHQHARQGNSFYGGRPRHTQNRHKAKLDEIKKSLTHRSNVKRNYFKMLKKEGLSIPELESKFSDEKEKTKKTEKKVEEESGDESGDESDGSDGSGSDEEQGGFFEGETSDAEVDDLEEDEEEEKEDNEEEEKPTKRRKPLPDQQPPTKEQLREIHESQKPRKPITFKERAALAKERKEKAREEREAQIQKNREDRERKLKKRAKLTKQMTKTTRTGQPLMTPRINRILDQLKQ